MKKIFLLLLLSLCSLLFFACGKKVDQENTNAYFAFRTPYEEGDGRWGIMDQEGKVVFKNRFDSEPRAISGNRFYVQHEGDSEEYYYQLYTLEANPKVLGEKYKDITPFYEGVALVSRENKPISLIDTMGRIIVEALKYKDVPIDEAGEYRGGYAYVKQGDLYGFVNTKGEVHIPLKYVWVTHFRDGYALAIEEKYRQALEAHDYDKIEIQALDVSGKVVSRLSAEQLMGNTDFLNEECLVFFDRSSAIDNPFVEGRKVVYNEHRAVGIISIEGKMLLKFQPQWNFAEIFRGKYLSFREGRKFGLASLDGQVLITPKYDDLIVLGESRFFASEVKDNLMQGSLIDEQGNRLSNNYYGVITVLPNGNLLMPDVEGHHLVRSKDGKRLASFPETGAPEEVYVYSRQISVLPTLKLLNITDSSIGGKTLDMTAPEIARKFEKELRYSEKSDIIPLYWQYPTLAVNYTYHFTQSVLSKEGERLPLHPDSLVVRIGADSFLRYTPSKKQRQEIVKQVLDDIATRGKLVSRSDNEVVLKSASDAYLRATAMPDAEGIVLVYSYYMFDVPYGPHSGDTVVFYVGEDPIRECDLPTPLPDAS